MLNAYAVTPHYHNMVHLLAIMNKAELMRDCLQRNFAEIKSLSVTHSPLHFAT
jgi:predicted metal-dependent HD superfamily phosphohydrolase